MKTKTCAKCGDTDQKIYIWDDGSRVCEVCFDVLERKSS